MSAECAHGHNRAGTIDIGEMEVAMAKGHIMRQKADTTKRIKAIWSSLNTPSNENSRCLSQILEIPLHRFPYIAVTPEIHVFRHSFPLSELVVEKKISLGSVLSLVQMQS